MTLTPERRALLRRLRTDTDAGAPRAITRRSGTGPVPLSPGQRRLWFLDQFKPGDPAYVIAAGAWLRGPLDHDRLARALGTVVRRHEALRTVLRADTDGDGIGIVQPWTPLAMPVVDVAGEPEALARAEQLAAEPMNLAEGPLLRVACLRAGPDNHLLVLAVHHAVADGWSLEVILGEGIQLYAGADLPPLDVQYADYAAWMHDWLATPAARAQEDYWRDRLAGAGLLDLPTDRPRPAQAGFAGAHAEFVVPAAVAAQVNRLAEREHTTPFVVGLAAFAAVLHRWSGQDDLVIGTPVAGRTRAEAAPLAGFFVNTLALRLDVSADPDLPALVRRARDTVLDAQSHADLPFDRLVEVLKPDRDATGRTPLLRHLFQFYEHPRVPVPMADVALTPVKVGRHTSKFDLTVELVPRADGGLDGCVEYSTDLYDDASVRRLAAALVDVLSQLDSGSTLADLTVLGAVDRARLLDDHSGAAVPALDRGPATVHGHIEAQAARTPDAVAVTFGDTTLTYADLDARANRLARVLQEHGAGPGRIVGVAQPRSAELMVTLLAVLKAGAAYLPLETDYPPSRIALMLEDSGAAVVVTDTTAVPTALQDTMRTAGPVVLCPHRDADLIAAQPVTAPEVTVTGRDLAYVIFTSGSTGRPKGAMNEHRAVLNRLLWHHDTLGLAPGERVLQKTPIGFDVSVWELFWPLLVGGTVSLAAPGAHRDPDRLVEAITHAGATIIHFVPSMLALFLTARDLASCTSLTRIVCSGEELPATLVRECERLLPGVPVHNLYGPTEAAVDVTWYPSTEGVGARVPIGRPIAGARLYVVDRGGALAPYGLPGELLIGGTPVARGYWNRPALTAERFVPDPYGHGERLYRTGDLARWRDDGCLEYLGRIDHQVKLNGVRIELGEIEAVLAGHPAVDSAVLGVRSGGAGSSLTAWVLPVADAAPAAELWPELREFLRERLPAPMVPGVFVAVDAWPLSPNGKLDRKQLPDPAAPAVAYEPPATELEIAVAKVWAQALGRDGIGATDDFFALGGHSLVAIRIVTRLRAEHHVELPLSELFAAPTVRGVAAAITAAARRTPAPALRRADRSRYRITPTDQAGVRPT
ncbi:amino acid adenylation domain-containing protein [Actinoplanes sp. NPDC051859]|uniref:amino acid adenylation domain-containing protein n=1 Tax=Actinoplanes sp. NPDC051859 TaxID=3363909 RepID=UPI00378C2AD5